MATKKKPTKTKKQEPINIKERIRLLLDDNERILVVMKRKSDGLLLLHETLEYLRPYYGDKFLVRPEWNELHILGKYKVQFGCEMAIEAEMINPDDYDKVIYP